MAIGYDIIVESIGDVHTDETFLIIVTNRGIVLRDSSGNNISSKLYKYLRIKIVGIYEHVPLLCVQIGDKRNILKYSSLTETKKAYRLFKQAIKNSNVIYGEYTERISDNPIIFRERQIIKAHDTSIGFLALEHTEDIDDWAIKKIRATFKEVLL